ncbi:MAG: hypothetical protein IJ934_04345 [Acetobacter sp.]|nr:hypothetical protein [Acetobacter sp.]
MIIRPFTCFCAALAIASGFFLYTKKHQTTLLDQKISDIVHDTKQLQAQTAVLRTEWTLENQPERLEQLAHRYTPYLQTMNPSQFVRITDLEDHLPAPKGVKIRSKKPQTTPQKNLLSSPHDHEKDNKLIATNQSLIRPLPPEDQVPTPILTQTTLIAPTTTPSFDTQNNTFRSDPVHTATNTPKPNKFRETRMEHPGFLPRQADRQEVKSQIFLDERPQKSLPPPVAFPMMSQQNTKTTEIPLSTTTLARPPNSSNVLTYSSRPVTLIDESSRRIIRHPLPIAAATWHSVRSRKMVEQQPLPESRTAYVGGSVINHEANFLPPPVPLMR